MPVPLRVKPPKPGFSSAATALAVCFLGYLALLAWLWINDSAVHLQNPILNLFAHSPILLIPALIVINALSSPIRYESPRGETLIEYGSYINSFKYEWWMSLMLWPSAILGLSGVSVESFCMATGMTPGWTTYPGEALLTGLLVFGMCFFFGNL